MNYKALVVDVDRTLITTPNALPSKKVTDAIKNVQKRKNAKIILSTARPFNQIKHIYEHLQLSDFAVTSGGAAINNLRTGKLYKEYCLSIEKIREVIHTIISVDSHIDFWIQDNGTDYRYTKDYIPKKPFIIVVHHLSIEKADELLKQLSHISGIFCTKSLPYDEKFIDIHITHEQGTKEKSVNTVLDMLHISKEQTIGVGDAYNDIQFIALCGLKVAMGNAVNPVKKIADYIAPSVDEDGIATVIEKYML